MAEPNEKAWVTAVLSCHRVDSAVRHGVSSLLQEQRVREPDSHRHTHTDTQTHTHTHTHTH
eukprot:COSAG03_NODE_10801_length_627_cov_7.153409_1_plen_60_part_10